MTERLRDAIDMLRGELRHGIDGPGAELTLRVAAAEVCRVAEAEQEADERREALLARVLGCMGDYVERWRQGSEQVQHVLEMDSILREAGRNV